MRPGQRARAGRPGAGAVGAGDGEVIVVRSQQALRELEAYLLSGDRSQPVVALTRLAELNEPVLAPGGVRAVVGGGPRIYYLPGEYLLRRLEGVLGRRLALPAAGVRVWWPGLCTRSAPGDHPYVLALDSESQSDMLAEFAREFDLSRPLVREEITVIEAARALAEYELSRAREQNRLMQVRLDRVLTRAQRAERALQSGESPVGQTGRDAP